MWIIMSVDDKFCDNGSKNLQERKLIPRITTTQTEKITLSEKNIFQSNNCNFFLLQFDVILWFIWYLEQCYCTKNDNYHLNHLSNSYKSKNKSNFPKIGCSPYIDTICMDIDGWHTFWQILSMDYCKFSYYDGLYEGYALYEQPQIV